MASSCANGEARGWDGMRGGGVHGRVASWQLTSARGDAYSGGLGVFNGIGVEG